MVRGAACDPTRMGWRIACRKRFAFFLVDAFLDGGALAPMVLFRGG
jgi:hypothetical protein